MIGRDELRLPNGRQERTGQRAQTVSGVERGEAREDVVRAQRGPEDRQRPVKRAEVSDGLRDGDTDVRRRIIEGGEEGWFRRDRVAPERQQANRTPPANGGVSGPEELSESSDVARIHLVGEAGGALQLVEWIQARVRGHLVGCAAGGPGVHLAFGEQTEVARGSHLRRQGGAQTRQCPRLLDSSHVPRGVAKL